MGTHRFFLTALLAVATTGCSQPTENATDVPTPASLQVRAARCAYTGAPPVIPHPPLSSRCVACHTPSGRVVPTVGVAPANPHTKTPGFSEQSRCNQCHVFQQTEGVFTESAFVGFHAEGRTGDRDHPMAPPTVPHALFLHEDCQACHGGPAARPEIVCKHADRVRCRQCHVQQEMAGIRGLRIDEEL